MSSDGGRATATAGAAAAGRAGAGRRAGERRRHPRAAARVEADDVVGGHVERGPLLAVLALELAGPEATLDEDAVALAELLGGALGAVAEDADAEPVGLLDPLAALLVLGLLWLTATLNWVTGRPFGV